MGPGRELMMISGSGHRCACSVKPILIVNNRGSGRGGPPRPRRRPARQVVRPQRWVGRVGVPFVRSGQFRPTTPWPWRNAASPTVDVDVMHRSGSKPGDEARTRGPPLPSTPNPSQPRRKMTIGSDPRAPSFTPPLGRHRSGEVKVHDHGRRAHPEHG
jgi:hypothetical protein